MKEKHPLEGIDRRTALSRVGGVALASVALSCGGRSRPEVSLIDAKTRPVTTMPAVYVPHGGGPWPFVEMNFGSPGTMAALRTYFESLAIVPPSQPRALLLVSAHWETDVPTVQTAVKPPMLYDYSGFPEAAYKLQWPAPGAPEIAGEVRALLESAGIASAADAKRGFDHGTFVVTKVAWPGAGVPTFQLSLKRGLDPAEHLAIGQAIAPLRKKGVFIIGSGMSYHNMRGFGAIM
ncbi:MAG: aromatic ring-opening dioxygenase catalytic subunit (LigB family), partial [Myxococcota bacterium]